MSELKSLLANLIGDSEWERHRALEALRSGGAAPEAVEELAEALASDDPARRNAARMALAALAHPDSPAREAAVAVLEEALRSPVQDLRVLAASTMGESGNRGLAEPLIGALADPEPNVVAAATDALGELGDPAAVGPLAELLPQGRFWVDMAAVVALGRLRDPRGLPALARAAGERGLQPAVAEAIRRINHPEGLTMLEALSGSAPEESLLAAGALLSAHPDLDPPSWVAPAARAREDALAERLVDDDDPAVARLLGLAGTRSAVQTLLTLAAPPRRSEAAIAGIMAVPGDRRVDPVLDRLERADPDDLAALLALLPPLEDEGRIGRVVPMLRHGSAAVRSAAAEALARSPAEHALPVLAGALGERPVQPEVVRAVGGLGMTACAALVPLLRDAVPEVRGAAAEALARCADPGVRSELEAALGRETDAGARRSLVGALAVVAGADAVPILRDALEDPDPGTRAMVIEALGATRSPEAAPLLDTLLRGPDWQRLAAIHALGELEDPAAVSILEPCLESSDLETRRAAARALLPHGARVMRARLENLSRDADGRIRGWAARMLAAHGERGREIIRGMATQDPDPDVRAEALRALEA